MDKHLFNKADEAARAIGAHATLDRDGYLSVVFGDYGAYAYDNDNKAAIHAITDCLAQQAEVLRESLYDAMDDANDRMDG